MKHNQRQFCVLVAVLCITLATSARSFAADPANTGFSMIFQNVFGKEDARISNPTTGAQCSTMDADGGMIGGINGFFCHMKVDMGLTALGSATKTFGPMKVRATYFQGCTGIDGVNYLLGANVWVCAAPADCTNPANFSRAVSACFTTTGDLGTNTGVMISDNGAFSGTPGTSAVYAKWELGSGSATNTFSMKMVQGSVFSGRADGTRTDPNHMSATIVMYNGGGAAPATTNSGRFAVTLNRASNTANAYMEGFNQAAGSGFGTYSAVASSDTPATGACVTRAAAGTDWVYSVTGTGAACAPSIAFPADSITSVKAYTYASVVGTWNGMTANPSSL